MKLAIIGPQGSGKGTQAQLLAKHFKIVHVSTGDLLREEVARKTALGIEADSYMSRGALVPDDIVLKMLEHRLKQPDALAGFILDGYPRNLAQAEALDRLTPLDAVIEVHVSDRESIKRISGRRSCACGAVYHTLYNPPRLPNLCDLDQKPLFQREDDKEETVRQRLHLYHEKTEPLLDFYRQKGILHTVNGEQAIEQVFGAIINHFGKATG